MKLTPKLVVFFLLIGSLVRGEPLQVVTTIPDIADISRRIGGNEVELFSIASGREDPHNVPLKPSAIQRLARADLFIQLGLDLEHAYAPALLRESRNQNIQRGKPGFLDLSGGVEPIEVPTSVDRREGDVHPNGNPHYNLDPVYGQVMARTIAIKLSQLRPEKSALFKQNANELMLLLRDKIKGWRQRIGEKPIKFVSYHPDLLYFSKRFGLQSVGTIQPKPGIEPGPQYIADLAERMKKENVTLILKESFYSNRIPDRLAQLTGAKVVNIPILVNGTPEAGDYISLIETLVNAITQ